MKRRDFFQGLAGSALGLGVTGLAGAAQSTGYEHIPKDRMEGQHYAQWLWRKSRNVSPHWLTQGWHLFADWRYVDVSDLRWTTADGTPIKLKDAGSDVLQTKKTGEVRVEVARPEAKAIENRDFQSCDPIVDDHLERPVTWRGQSDVGHTEDETIVFRFRLRQASIFSFCVV